MITCEIEGVHKGVAEASQQAAMALAASAGIMPMSASAMASAASQFSQACPQTRLRTKTAPICSQS